MQVEGTGHKHYIVTYLDDKSGYSRVFVLGDKSQHFATFKAFHKLLTMETGQLLKQFIHGQHLCHLLPGAQHHPQDYCAAHTITEWQCGTLEQDPGQ